MRNNCVSPNLKDKHDVVEEEVKVEEEEEDMRMKRMRTRWKVDNNSRTYS